MLLKDLIKDLQTLYDEEYKHIDILGEPEIMVDIFGKNENGGFDYKGFSPEIRIERSSDFVYSILTAFEKK